MDLADDGVLVHELAIAAPQLGYVLDEDHAAGVVLLDTERNDTAADHLTADLDLCFIGSPGRHGVPQSSATGEVFEVHPDELSIDVESSSRSDGVRRGESDLPRRGDDHDSFTNARRLPRFHAGIRERPLRDHAEERVGASRVRLFQLVDLAAAERHAFSDDHGYDLVVNPDRCRFAVHSPAVDAALLNLAGAKRSDRLGCVLGDQRRSDVVVRIKGLGGEGTYLRQCQKVLVRVVLHGSEQEKIGERQVGEHLPDGDEAMEVLDLMARDPAGAGAQLL